jgi:hypothetical protein
MEQMLDALMDETSEIPRREIMKKLLRVQFEKEVAMTFAETFCRATGDITPIINSFLDFKKFTEGA